jgi:hypothetical protein
LEFPNARRWIDLLDFSQQPAIPFDRTLQVGNWQAEGKRLDLRHDTKASSSSPEAFGIRIVVREGRRHCRFDYSFGFISAGVLIALSLLIKTMRPQFRCFAVTSSFSFSV